MKKINREAKKKEKMQRERERKGKKRIEEEEREKKIEREAIRVEFVLFSLDVPALLLFLVQGDL